MEIKNKNVLKNVKGGQAVLPLLSCEGKTVGAVKLVGATKIVNCRYCGAGMPYTSGKDVCPVCGREED